MLNMPARRTDGAGPARPASGPDLEALLGRILPLVWVAALLLAIAFPLMAMLGRAFLAADGGFVGLAHFAEVAGSPGLVRAALNSFAVSAAATLVVVPLAFGFAFALTRTATWGRGVFRQVALLPLLAPSLMPAISLVYLFGNQGLLKDWVGGSVYGFWGVLAGEVFYTFPHAFLILATALAASDARLAEAARVLGAGPVRRFFSVTLPAARYGLVSAALVVFTLVVTDFGVPKVVGGDFNVLAVEAFKQVIGQQNFERGAVVGLMLLVPALLTFGVERRLARRQAAALSARAVPFAPSRRRGVDLAAFAGLTLVSFAIVSLLAVGVAASLLAYWPYDLSFTLAHYDFSGVDGGGWSAYVNSLTLATASALVGAPLVFLGAYWTEKLKAAAGVAPVLRAFALLPMAVPGLVLGLGYVFFFNHPANPLRGLYGGMALMAVCTVAHFYTTAHLTAATALKQLDAEFEAVAASLKVPFWVTLYRVTLPVCTPALIDVARFFFVSAMTTVSALIFLYSPDSSVAAVALVTMDDAGDTAAAAAMATLIVATSAAVSLALSALEGAVSRRKARWKSR
ncbi:iron(III) transport system permease protein [Crenobacter luteus]|uniref:putative 2-aminoethylphosphonate ABC transporter permease subunit n=1 Tax=Crenobacter luteus TaxID=1452487 RepID=UPI0010EC4D3C|nr:putative 2-aminoethylphosphonate ABC transporter permease subunit [Crenobacter luteus]TCP15553.1 iron(III) transport system permease protein [Crenobacter luteus]